MCADFNLLMRAAADGYGDTIKRNQKAAAAAVSSKFIIIKNHSSPAHA